MEAQCESLKLEVEFLRCSHLELALPVEAEVEVVYCESLKLEAEFLRCSYLELALPMEAEVV